MDKSKIRIGSVSYLNARPLIQGFANGVMKDELELVIDYPAAIANRLINDKIDIGLVPVAIIPQLKEHYIVSDYCIGCDGEVASVCLFSEVPLDKITTILLDYQSRTSVDLLRILLNYWNISPRLINGQEGYEKEISGTTAGLVIGDRAFAQRLSSTFIYDLGSAWKEMTGMPFVFAAWVANKKISPAFLEKFNAANKNSLMNLDEILQENQAIGFDVKKYFTKHISYELDLAKKQALNHFFELAQSHAKAFQTG